MNRGAHDDDSLLEEVLRVLRGAEPVPAGVVNQARSAFAWRNLSAALAELVFDSAIDDDDLARVRGRSTERRLSFRGASVTLEVSITDGGTRLVGNISPPRRGTIELRHPRTTTTTSIDDSGSFLFDLVPSGSVSLACTSDDGQAIETEWITI